MTKLRQSVLVWCGLALAIPACGQQHSHGYFYVGPGGISGPGRGQTTVALGAGAEAALPRGLGAGVELGALGPSGGLLDVLGVFSLNGYYHFSRSGGKLDPFATAGYSLFFREGTANLFNFGGGVNYWFLSHLGLRTELRDHVRSSGGTFHYWNFRVGLTFR